MLTEDGNCEKEVDPMNRVTGFQYNLKILFSQGSQCDNAKLSWIPTLCSFRGKDCTYGIAQLENLKIL